MSVRWIAYRENGDGTQTFLDYDVPLTGGDAHTVLNGDGGISGTVAPEYASMKTGGRPLFIPWSTCLALEVDGQIRGAGIVTSDPASGPDLQVNADGYSTFLHGQPYMGDWSAAQGDPLHVARNLWQHIQSWGGPFNLGVTFTGASDSRDAYLADADRDAGIPTDQDVEKLRLAWYENTDLGRVFDQMADLAPFEWTFRHSWSGNQIKHELVFGYPTIGRRTDIVFEPGVNLLDWPTVEDDGDEYASHVLYLGAGEGRDMIRAVENRTTDRLGRYVVLADKALTTSNAAKTAARQELGLRGGNPNLSTLRVLAHPNAPIGSYSVGDEVLVRTAPGWHEKDLWVRILGIHYAPDDQTITLEVVRAE